MSTTTYQIDPENETLVTFDESPKLIQKWLPGKSKVSKAAVHRWNRAGVSGVYLPSVLIAGVRYSTAGAFKWFFAESSAARHRKLSAATKNGIRKSKSARAKEASELGI